MILLQEKVLGTLLGSFLGSGLASDGNVGPLGLQAAWDTLQVAAVSDGGCGDLSRLRESEGSADAVLACLPIVLLGFTMAPSQFAERIVSESLEWVDESDARRSVLLCAEVLATLLRLPSERAVSWTLPKGIAARATAASETAALRALRYFCEAAGDYRACLGRAIRDPQWTPAMTALTGAFLGAYQGTRGIPILWQVELYQRGIWQEFQRLATSIVADWAGQRLPSDRPFVVGPARSLQARGELHMPSWY